MNDDATGRDASEGPMHEEHGVAGAGVPMTTGRPEGFVVVGVSGSSGSPVALRWALDAARLRGLRLVAVRAYKVPSTAAGSVRPTPSRVADAPAVLEGAARDELEAHVRSALGADATEVELRAVRGGRRRVLLAASAGAAMLVVDAPRARELSGDPAFARSLIYRAPCPVVVMPPHVARTDPAAWVEGARTAR